MDGEDLTERNKGEGSDRVDGTGRNRLAMVATIVRRRAMGTCQGKLKVLTPKVLPRLNVGQVANAFNS